MFAVKFKPVSGSVRRSGDHRPERSEVTSGMEESQEEAVREIRKALWHVFDMLDTGNTGVVHVSQLRVITSSVGLQYGVKKAEEFLNLDGVTDMDFSTYFEIVKTNVLNSDQKQESSISSPFKDTIKTCWRLCNFERNHKSSYFTSEHCMMLWRMYNFLSETDADGETLFPLQLDSEEAVLLVRGFIDVTGQRSKECVIETFLKETGDDSITFNELLNVFERDLVVGLSGKNISAGLHELYDTYISSVLIKGMMWKRGFKHKSWKERWLILTPTQLRYFVSQNEKVLKGTIVFDENSTIEVPPDRPTHKQNRFIITTTKKPYDMSAHDIKIKNEWVSAIQLALGRVGKDPNIQREAAIRRCCARRQRREEAADAERRRREEEELNARRQQELDEEKRKRQEDEQLLRARLGELEEERKRRLDTEALLAEETALREAEQARLRELEEIRRQLERLLEEERQAKNDEEIVRNLQAKLLEEEFERRAELERLQALQAAMLEAEREERAALEGDRKVQEQLLAEAKERLEQLDAERRAADDKMQEAAEKLQRAEKDRKILEEKARLWRQPVGLARLITPSANPLITHRGVGAFCNDDFVKKGAESTSGMVNHDGAVVRADSENAFKKDVKEDENNKVKNCDDEMESTKDSKESSDQVRNDKNTENTVESGKIVFIPEATEDKDVGDNGVINERRTEDANNDHKVSVGKTTGDLVNMDKTEQTKLQEKDVASSTSQIHYSVNNESDSETDDEANCAHVQEHGTASLEQERDSDDHSSPATETELTGNHECNAESETETEPTSILESNATSKMETEVNDGDVYDNNPAGILEDRNSEDISEQISELSVDEKTEQVSDDEKQHSEYMFSDETTVGNVISQKESESDDDNNLGSNGQSTSQTDKTVVTCEKDCDSDTRLTDGKCNDISVSE